MSKETLEIGKKIANSLLAIDKGQKVVLKDGYIKKSNTGYIIRHYENGGWEEVDDQILDILEKEFSR